MTAGQRGGLGRGLDALLKRVPDDKNEIEVRTLSIDAIIPNPYQPRKDFSTDTLGELCESIRLQGVLQPILVRLSPSGEAAIYQLIAGERRWRASRMAGLKVIPAIVRDISDEDSLIITIIENLQREDLNALDQAKGLRLLQDTLKLSQDDLALKVGKSRPAVANLLRLLQLPSAIQEDVRNGHLSAGHARTLLSIEDPTQQLELKRLIESLELSVRKAEFYATYWHKHRSFPLSEFEAKASAGGRSVRSKSQTPYSGDLAGLQQRLTDVLPVRVRLCGTSENGQIIFSFATPDELRSLLLIFGLENILSGED
ncbi:ParB family transcriptional regulator, chromosome partitioning protein [Desulfovibrionales bacterium]